MQVGKWSSESIVNPGHAVDCRGAWRVALRQPIPDTAERAFNSVTATRASPNSQEGSSASTKSQFWLEELGHTKHIFDGTGCHKCRVCAAVKRGWVLADLVLWDHGGQC